MLLTIDVGNTNTVLGMFDGDRIVEHWRINTDPDRTADEIAVLLRGLLEHSPLVKDADVSGIALCSTVPSVLHEMREMCRRYYGDIPSLIIEPGVRTGVSVRMDNPKEVGSDRIMNTVAAVHLYGGPAIVVDFGTSTNFDAASAKGEFVGGALAPGIEISVDALTRRAAQLLKVELTRPHHVIGKNTVEALQSGIIFGFAGQIEGIARRMARELAPEDPDSVTVIATGGLAPLVIDEVSVIDAYEPWLTLIGLRLVFERNHLTAWPGAVCPLRAARRLRRVRAEEGEVAEDPVELGEQGPGPHAARRDLDAGQPLGGQHHAELAGERTQPVMPVGQDDDLPVVAGLEEFLGPAVHIADDRVGRHDPVALQGQPQPQHPVPGRVTGAQVDQQVAAVRITGQPSPRAGPGRPAAGDCLGLTLRHALHRVRT